MKKSNTLLKISACITILSIFIIIAIVYCSMKRERIIPTKPLIIIEITSVEQTITSYAYKYKIIDKQGYIFYITEQSGYCESPKRGLGDTIK